MLRAVNSAVEAHGLPDTDGQPGNAYNANIQVFYTDADGNVLGPVGGGFVPAKIGTKDVKGVRVVVWNPFSAFIAQIIGQANLRVSAEAVAVYQPPISCNGWAIFGGCTGNCQPNVLKATGGGQAGVVNGNIHSNADINISQRMYINGVCDYVTEKKGNGTCQTAQQGGYIPMPQFYRYEDFLPGGSKWNQVDASRRYYFRDSITLKSSGPCPSSDDRYNDGGSYKLCDGLYVVNGDVTIQGGGTVTLTIVTNGEIKSTSSNNDDAYFKGFYREPDGKGQLLFFSTSNDTNNGAIQLSYARISWEGLIYAPNGLVNLSGSRGFTGNGAIFGYEVDVSGANFRLTYNDNACPTSPPQLFLFK
jgi:hypothetical protein